MNSLTRFARRYLLADAAPLSAQERWRSTVAAFLGMLLIQGVLAVLPGAAGYHHLLAPLGASSVILFALPHSPLGQPWSTAGGLALSALVGIACACWIQPAWLAIAAALAISVWLMARLRCIHPPGGAMAVVFAGSTAALQGPGAVNAFSNVLAVLLAGVVVNALIPGRRWPQGMREVADDQQPERPRTGIRHEDLQYALAQVDGYLDINEDDLVQVYDLALGHAHARQEQRCCGEIMTRSVLSVEFATPLDEAWDLLRAHHLKALPVIDRAQRVIGLISAEDFLAHVPLRAGQSMRERLRAFLERNRSSHSDKAEVVGQVMNRTVVVARATDSIARVAGMLAGRQHPPAVPVIDEARRLVGIIGQTDLLAAFCHQQAVALQAGQGGVATP